VDGEPGILGPQVVGPSGTRPPKVSAGQPPAHPSPGRIVGVDASAHMLAQARA